MLSYDQFTTDPYKAANKDSGKYIIDINKVNNVAKRLVELIDISNTDVTKIHASQLDNSDKLLLKFLTYMFGTGHFAIDTDSFITTTEI
ncbi:MAG: hypothetical protein MJ223_04165 [Mycoplasmoidaceae bacterium]|nr:hypothetical protein [Mycoplasmoidaceae bacterium]